MAAPNPIQGTATVNVGSTVTYSSTTPAGVWSSTDTAVMTIVAGTGVATSVAAGTCQIVYTVGSDSTALSVTVNTAVSLTNGVNFNTVYAALQNRVLWQSQGLASDSQRYYEDFHPLNNTEVADACRPKNGLTLTQFLANEQRSVIMECLQSVYNAPQVVDRAKLAFYRLAGNQLPIQLVANGRQFVGLRLNIGKGDRSIKLNSIQLCFTKAASFNLYLYNDMIADPVLTIPVTCQAAVNPVTNPTYTTAVLNQTIIPLGETVILSNLVPTAYKQGTWYFGYYQPDITDPELGNDPDCQAIYYPVNYSGYHACTVLAFSSNMFLGTDGKINFYRNNIGANNLMYGMNLEISSFVDATNSIVQNAHLFDEVFGSAMAVRRVESIIYNYQTNAVQRAISDTPIQKLYADLNGYYAEEGQPRIMGLKDRMQRAIQTAKQGMQVDKRLFVGVS